MSTDTTTNKSERGGWTSASNAAPDRKCEGRHLAQKGMPDVSSDDARFGNEIHDALKLGTPSKLNTQQLSVYESCVEITDNLMTKVFGAEKAKASVYRERRFWCKVLAVPGDKAKVPKRYEHSGMLDFVARLGPKALIIEYKSLPGDIEESPTNDQLRDQVVLAAGNLVLSEAVTAIVQPLVTHDPDLCLYNSDAIKKAEQEMYVRVRKSNNPNAKRVAGPTQCKFCLARNTCQEYQTWAASLVPETASVAGVPVASWTPEQRAHFLNMRGVAQKWLDECTDEMKRLITEDAAAIPGWSLREGNKIETVNDPQELFTRFNALARPWAEKEQADLLTLYIQCVKVHKEDFESLLRKVSDLKGKGLKAKMDSLLEGITDVKQNAPSLARSKE